MSTPKISFRVPTPGATDDATGDVTTHDVASAPGKEREREPLYGGDLTNISQGMGMAVDSPGPANGGVLRMEHVQKASLTM